MAFISRGMQSAIQVVLAILIIVLAYFLYDSIVTPFAVVKRQKEVTEETRARMDQVRQALILYERRNGRFVTSLDSLVMWFRADSALAASTDSLFGVGFQVDSLPYSPRTGNRFELATNDTSRTSTYLLSDPDSDDFIGSLDGDITHLNAASWE
ncbi:MAG: hypothetical protein BMS9Abin05_1717 [Rhodothermia bacterium]|nr:MAG: hypothetical protein BMS9Abin05_1717 [Rhodothermia bacterium]